MKEEWRNAQHMARPVQSVPTKTTSVLSAYKPFHLRHQEKYSPRETCRKVSLRYMRYTKICNPHLRMNFGSCHSLNRSMLSAATRAEFMQPWKSGKKTVEMQIDTGISCNWANNWYIAKTVKALILLPGEYHTWGCNILKGNHWLVRLPVWANCGKVIIESV